MSRNARLVAWYALLILMTTPTVLLGTALFTEASSQPMWQRLIFELLPWVCINIYGCRVIYAFVLGLGSAGFPDYAPPEKRNKDK